MISTLSSGLIRPDFLTRNTAQQPGDGASKAREGNAAQAASAGTGAAGNPFLNISEDVLQNMKGAEETSNFLQKAAEKAEDDDRGMRIEQLRQKIEFLKERLKFATPEQAKALLRELKQIAKEFKQAAKSLSDGGMSMMTGVAGVGTQAQANANAPAGETTAGAGVEAGASTTASVSGAATAGTPDGGGTPGANSTDPAADGQNAPDAQTAPETANETANAAADEASLENGGQAVGTGPQVDRAEAGTPAQAKNLPADVQQALAAYSQTSAAGQPEQETEQGYNSMQVRKGHAETLRELKSEIDFIAAKIKILIDRDDKESKEETKKAMSDLEDGMQALREFEAIAGAAGESGSGEAPAPGTDTVADTGTGASPGPAMPSTGTALPASTGTVTVTVQPQIVV